MIIILWKEDPFCSANMASNNLFPQYGKEVGVLMGQQTLLSCPQPFF